MHKTIFGWTFAQALMPSETVRYDIIRLIANIRTRIINPSFCQTITFLECWKPNDKLPTLDAHSFYLYPSCRQMKITRSYVHVQLHLRGYNICMYICIIQETLLINEDITLEGIILRELAMLLVWPSAALTHYFGMWKGSKELLAHFCNFWKLFDKW